MDRRGPDDEVERAHPIDGPLVAPPPLERAAYRLHLRRLDPEHHDWIVADLASAGVRRRFVATASAALVAWWVVNLVLFSFPASAVVPLSLFFVAVLVGVTRPGPWGNVEQAVLRRHGIATVAQIAGAREGRGHWVDGQWWCDEHGRRFCRHCAPS